MANSSKKAPVLSAALAGLENFSFAEKPQADDNVVNLNGLVDRPVNSAIQCKAPHALGHSGDSSRPSQAKRIKNRNKRGRK